MHSMRSPTCQHTKVGAADVMDKHQRSNEEMEMAGQQQLELSHKVRDRVRLMKWDVLNAS